MTANAATAGQTSDSTGPRGLVKVIYIFCVLLVAFLLYKGFHRVDDPGNKLWWTLVVGWLLVTGLVFIVLTLSPGKRRFWFFAFFFLALVILISAFIQDQLTGNPRVGEAVSNSTVLSFFIVTYADTIIWSIILGFVIALCLVGLPLLLIAYAASAYVLALHEFEGVSRRDALRYVITLILGNNLPYIEVENGQVLITKEGGGISLFGGPGELIVKHGNVVVLERGGKISRVLNAGVHSLKPLEKVRNVFVLTPQSDSDKIEHVLTKDRIPLDITLGISVWIEPASETDKRPESRIAPDGEGLTERLDDGLYQVYEGTIRKAARTSQATSFAQREFKKCDDKQICQDVEETTWKKVAAVLPKNELRDHIMSHRFDELFELVDSAPGEEPKVRVDKRKIYEIEQAILEQIKPGRLKGFGVLVRGVDIGKIEFPVGAERSLLDRWTADVQAQAVVTRARARAQSLALKGQGEGEARAAFFREVLREMKREAVLMDSEMVRAVLMQMTNAVISVTDVETFVKAMTFLDRPSRKRVEASSEEAGSNGKNLERHQEEPKS